VCSRSQWVTFWSPALLDVVTALLNRNTSASRQWVKALAQQTCHFTAVKKGKRTRLGLLR
jgi:hypothetical protein